MGLLAKTLAVSTVMAGFYVLPRFFRRIERHATVLLLIGTGALVSLLIADLLPDLWELGGQRSLGVALAVWALGSLSHLLHLRFHQGHGSELKDDAVLASGCHAHRPRPGQLILSMGAHCFSSGILLAVSSSFSDLMSRSVFLAMITHKTYEALSVSLVLTQLKPKRSAFFWWGLIYTSSLPIGVGVAVFSQMYLNRWLSPSTLHSVAVLVASAAVGSLLGCLVHDFAVPSWRVVQESRFKMGWLILGGAITLLTLGGHG